MKPLKHPSDVRIVVDADHHPALAPAHELGHSLVIIEQEIHAVAGRFPVRRVHVMEGVRTVVAFCAFEPGQVFHVGAGQALPGGGQVLLDPQQVDGRAGGGGAEGLAADFACEGMVLQVKESCGTLDVGEGFGAGHFLPFEDLARADGPFELADEFFEVVLYDAVQRDQVAVDVVKDFDGRCLGTHEIEGRAACKHFDVAFVGWEQGNESVGQTALTAHPRDNRLIHFVSKPSEEKKRR